MTGTQMKRAEWESRYHLMRAGRGREWTTPIGVCDHDAARPRIKGLCKRCYMRQWAANRARAALGRGR